MTTTEEPIDLSAALNRKTPRDIAVYPGPRMIPLSALRDGHEYPGGAINSRSTNCNENLEQLAASIKAENILQSLLVLPAPAGMDDAKGSYFVIDGNRRLAALRLLAARGEIDAALGVPAILLDTIDQDAALRKSLTANIENVPLHPVDRYETFAKIHREGKNAAEIAARYAVQERTVKQSLALGRLSAVIRNAWRAGEIDAEEAETYTLSNDHKQQETVFKRLKAQASSWQIRKAIIGDQNQAPMLKFVTREAYEAAGGGIIEDLFSENNPFIACDPDLLKKLADEKLAEKCAALVKNGWAWAGTKEEYPFNRVHTWTKLPVTAKKADADDKARSGCVVHFNDGGQFDIEYGLVKPKTAKQAKAKKQDKTKNDDENDGLLPTAADGAAASGEEKKISQALARSLNQQFIEATGNVLAENHEVALAATIAGLLSWSMGPVRISARGMNSDQGAPEDFADAFARALAMTLEEKLACLARIAGDALDFSDDPAAATPVIEALPRESFTQTLWATFDMKEYFASAPRAVTLAAIKESMGREAVKPLLSKKKDAIAAFAAEELRARSWLPPELRTAHYSGPDANRK